MFLMLVNTPNSPSTNSLSFVWGFAAAVIFCPGLGVAVGIVLTGAFAFLDKPRYLYNKSILKLAFKLFVLTFWTVFPKLYPVPSTTISDKALADFCQL